MKKEIRPLLTATCVAVFCYLLGAFYAADFNIANWEKDVRFAVILFAGPFVPFSYAASKDLNF
jgi:hypothetical protein